MKRHIISCLLVLATGIINAALPPERVGEAFYVPYYTGSILPTPKKVTYGEGFLSLATTGILPAPGMKPDDARIAFLLERIERYGGTPKIVSSLSDDCDTFLVLNGTDDITRPKLPDSAEAFTIHCAESEGKDLVLLDAKDNLGMLWAITAFNQMVTEKDGEPVWRKTEVVDYPDVPAEKRAVGFGGIAMVGSTGDDHSTANALNLAWFAAQFRYGNMFFDRVWMENSKQWWKDGASEGFKEGLNEVSSFLNPLGIEWYARIFPIRGLPKDKINSGSEKDFKSIFSIASAIAEAGGNIMLTYDDHRFPMNPADQEQFGSAREADVFFINKLYAALKEKYPSVKMSFCPPFYWGPLSLPAYPESRDEYLNAIGERLPEDIGIFWSGPRVKSTKFEKADLEWITERIKRKPCIWQNGSGIGYPRFWWHYGTEPITAFRDWYYDGFLDDISMYSRYVNIPMDCISLLPQADFLWNRKAYDPERSVKEAAGKVVGPENYKLLADVTEKLRAFDIYSMTVNPASVRSRDDIAAKRVELEAAWKSLLEANEPAITMWHKLDKAVKAHMNFAKKVESTREVKGIAKRQEKVLERAKEETGYDGTGFFLTPYDFLGGGPARIYAFQCEPRLSTWVYGARTRFSTMRASFNMLSPPEHDYELILSGQDDDGPTNCRIRIKINENTVFEGPNPFVQGSWTRHTFPVQGQFLRDNVNTLYIQNIEDSDIGSGPPFFVLNYAVLRPQTKASK